MGKLVPVALTREVNLDTHSSDNQGGRRSINSQYFFFVSVNTRHLTCETPKRPFFIKGFGWGNQSLNTGRVRLLFPLYVLTAVYFSLQNKI